jgi:hypothetical protein
MEQTSCNLEIRDLALVLSKAHLAYLHIWHSHIVFCPGSYTITMVVHVCTSPAMSLTRSGRKRSCVGHAQDCGVSPLEVEYQTLRSDPMPCNTILGFRMSPVFDT